VNTLFVNILLQKLAITVTVGSLLFSSATVAQVLPPAEKAARVEITQEPALELARDDLAIIRWTTNNPGGSDDHFGVVYYCTDLKKLSRTAKSHVRLNGGPSRDDIPCARGRPEKARRCAPEHCQRPRLASLIPCRSASDGTVDVTSTGATPSSMMPIFSAARRDRSRPRPATNGPRSLTFTFTDFPFRGFVTLTTEPIGNVVEAAVSALGLNVSPLEVLRPAKPGPYHEAFRKWLVGVGVAAGRSGCTINCIAVAGGGTAGRVSTCVQVEAETSPAATVLSISAADPRASFIIMAR
jgi:hypothetical protein